MLFAIKSSGTKFTYRPIFPRAWELFPHHLCTMKCCVTFIMCYFMVAAKTRATKSALVLFVMNDDSMIHSKWKCVNTVIINDCTLRAYFKQYNLIKVAIRIKQNIHLICDWQINRLFQRCRLILLIRHIIRYYLFW